jgi:hypothetical protein
MRAASSSEPSHTCGRGCLGGTLPVTLPYVLGCHALIRRLSRRLQGCIWVGESLKIIDIACSALATVTGRWRGCTAQPWDHPLTHRAAHGCPSYNKTFSGPRLSRQGSTCFALASSRGEVETTAAQSAFHTHRRSTRLPSCATPSRAKPSCGPAPLPPFLLSFSKPPGTHAPAAAWRARAQAASSRPLGNGRAWRTQGAKTRQDKTRGERCWGGGRACTCARHQAGTQATWAGQKGTYTGPSSP